MFIVDLHHKLETPAFAAWASRRVATDGRQCVDGCLAKARSFELRRRLDPRRQSCGTQSWSYNYLVMQAGPAVPELKPDFERGKHPSGY
jgi:hypothetical protein